MSQCCCYAFLVSKKIEIRRGKVTLNTVVMGNPLIEAAYTLNNLEQRIVSLMISQIDDKRDDSRYTYEFTIKELSNILGFEKNNDQYKRIDNVFESLSQRNICIDPKYSIDGSKTFCNWGVFKYWPGHGRLTITIAEDIAPFLLQLKGNWTKYKLEDVLKFRGEYTIRFFQWFMQERNKPSHAKKSKSGAWYMCMSLRDIRERLEMIPKEGKGKEKYPRWPDFRRRVLDPMAEEISEKSSILVGWDAIKKGRAVKEIVFHCTPKGTKSEKQPLTRPTPREAEEKRKAYILGLLDTLPADLQERYAERKASAIVELEEKQANQSLQTSRETLLLIATDMAIDELGEEIEAQAINSQRSIPSP